jgi:hypothetical protein
MILFKLLAAPITAPGAGLKFIFQQVQELANQELFDEQHIYDELLLLQVHLDDGEITEEEYLEREADIMVRLRAARARREEAERG